GLAGLVRHLVRARLARRKEGAVPRLEPALALGRAQGGPADEHDQPLLFGVLVVIGADAQPGCELVHREAELLTADQRPDAGVTGAVARRLVLVLRELELEEVGDAHSSPSQ